MSKLASAYGSRKSGPSGDFTKINKQNIKDMYDAGNYKGITEVINYLYETNDDEAKTISGLISDVLVTGTKEGNIEFLYEWLTDKVNPELSNQLKADILKQIIKDGSPVLIRELSSIREEINFTMENLDESLREITVEGDGNLIYNNTGADERLLKLIEILEFRGGIDPDDTSSISVLWSAVDFRMENSVRVLIQLGVREHPLVIADILTLWPEMERYLQDIEKSDTRSPVRSISKSPVRSISRSPVRSISKSPVRSISRSPVRTLSKSPVRSLSKSPVRSLSKSPVRTLSKSPVRSLSKSPVRSPSKSPVRTLSKSPVRSPSKSPVRSLSKSPVRSLSKSPVQSLSKSPVRYLSKSPVRYLSKSPVRYLSKSPVRYLSKSPIRSKLASSYGSRKSVQSMMDITEINSENIGQMYDDQNYKGITDIVNYLYENNRDLGYSDYEGFNELIHDLIIRSVQENNSEFLYEWLADEVNPIISEGAKRFILSEITRNGSLDLTETLFRVLEGINFTMKNIEDALTNLDESGELATISGSLEADEKLLMMIESLEYKGLIDPQSYNSQMVLLYAFIGRFDNSARQLNRLGIWLSPVKFNSIREIYPGIEQYFEDN